MRRACAGIQFSCSGIYLLLVRSKVGIPGNCIPASTRTSNLSNDGGIFKEAKEIRKTVIKHLISFLSPSFLHKESLSTPSTSGSIHNGFATPAGVSRSQTMRDQEFLRDCVSGRGVVVQIDAVARVRLDVCFKGPRCREGLCDCAWDRARACDSGAGFRPGAVAAAEDEVLI